MVMALATESQRHRKFQDLSVIFIHCQRITETQKISVLQCLSGIL